MRNTGFLFHICILLFTMCGNNCINFQQEDVSVQLEALDILADLLSRFGGLLITFHTTILSALLPQLSSPRQAVRKRYVVMIILCIVLNGSFICILYLDYVMTSCYIFMPLSKQGTF